MSSQSSDELTATVFGAVQLLSATRKANLLLDTALALIGAGQYVLVVRVGVCAHIRRYGPEVENYLEVYLRTPDLPRGDVVKALLARGNARKAGGESLLAKAEQGAFHRIPIQFLQLHSTRRQTSVPSSNSTPPIPCSNPTSNANAQKRRR